MLLSHNTLTVALIAACVAVEHGGAAEEKVTVEVDVFSGRPNPAWTMSPSDARATVRMLNRLPRSAPGALEDRLGYRGTIIRMKNTEWRLFRGRAFEVGKRVWRLDVDRRMERVALTSGKSFLDMATYKMVLEEAEHRGRAGPARLTNLPNLEMWLLESGRSQILWPAFSRLLQVVGAFSGRK